MGNFTGLAARVRAFLFGASDEKLTKNENRGGDNVASHDFMPQESPSKENASPDEGLLACSEIEKDKQEEDSSMMNRFPWDIYESVMLLEAYLEIEKYPLRRHVVLKKLSEDLRARAEKKGMKIDAVFRNANGMNLQYERFRYMMTGGKRGFQGPIPKSFIEAKALYEKDRPAYRKVLKDAMPKEKQEAPAPVEAPKDEKPVEEIKDSPRAADAATFSTRLPWDRWEWALLLEAYEEIQKKPFAKMAILQQLSDTLRTRATRQGMKIDDTFRNLNGMDLQYEHVLYIMSEGKQGLKGNLSKAFIEVKGIYLTDKDRFGMLLRKAKRDAGIEVVKEEKKFTPITVVDGKRVDTSPVKVSSPKISLKGVPAYCLSSYLYVLHLSFDLEKKLYALQLDTVQNLSDYMNGSEAQSLPYFEKAEILVKLGTYLDKHREVGISEDPEVEEKKSSGEPNSSVDAEPQEKEAKPQMTYAPPKPAPLLVSVYEEPSLFGNEESPEVKAGEEKKASSVKTQQVSSLSDLLALKTLGNDTPVAFTLQGRRISVGGWENLYIRSLKYLLPKYPDAFTSLRTRAMFFDKNYWIVRKAYQERLRKPVELNQDFCVEVDLSASDILNYLKRVLDRCEIDIDTFIIETERMEPDEEITASDATEKQITYDLEKEKIYEGLKPYAFSYFGEKQKIEGWEDLYRKCAFVLYEDYPGVFKKLLEECKNGDLRHFLCDTPEIGRTVKLGDHMYLHMGFTPYRMWSFLRYALVKCQVDFENLVVSFTQAEDKPNPSPVVTASPKDADAPTSEAAPEIEKPQKPETVSSSQEPTLADQIQQVLASHFSDGFEPKLRLNAKKFQKFFQETYGSPAPMDLAALVEEIRQVGTIRQDGRIYAKADDEDTTILKEIAHTLVSLLDGAASVVYRDTLYEKYRVELAQLSIYDASMMEGELAKLLPSGYTCRYAVYRGRSQRAYGEEIIDYIKASLCPIKEDAVYEQFWYIPKDKIDKLLNRDDDILHIKSTWFCYRNISLAPEEREKLRQCLLNEIWKKDYLTEDDILEVLEEDFPGIAADVSTFPPAVVRWSLTKLYPDDFRIVGRNLSDREHAGSASDALRVLCKKHTRLTEGELKGLRDKINFIGNYAGAVMEEMVRVSPDEWVRRDQVHFDHTIPRYIAKYMEGKECIPLQEVTGFLEFPNIGVKWSLEVLESYLYKNDGLCPFQLLQAAGGVSASGAYGAIVKRGGRITKHKDALIYLLARDDAWETDAEALGRIVALGLQAEKRLSDIQAIAKAARVERNHLRQPQK